MTGIATWLLSDGRVSFVIEAPSEGGARLLAKRAGQELEPDRASGVHRWLDPEKTSCMPILREGSPVLAVTIVQDRRVLDLVEETNLRMRLEDENAALRARPAAPTGRAAGEGDGADTGETT